MRHNGPRDGEWTFQLIPRPPSRDNIADSLVQSPRSQRLGLVLAWRLPILAIVALGVGLEAWTLFRIHDSLALNILGFVWTPDFIANWQAGSK